MLTERSEPLRLHQTIKAKFSSDKSEDQPRQFSEVESRQHQLRGSIISPRIM